MADPHGSYLTLGRARWLSWLDLGQSWALGISKKVVKKCHLLLHFLNLLCMLVEDMFAYKLRALGKERESEESNVEGQSTSPPTNSRASSSPGLRRLPGSTPSAHSCNTQLPNIPDLEFLATERAKPLILAQFLGVRGDKLFHFLLRVFATHLLSFFLGKRFPYTQQWSQLLLKCLLPF